MHALARRWMCCAVAAVTLCGGPAQGQAPPDPVAEAQARPLSPGAVALLLAHASEPSVVTRLSEALAHQDGAVRATAARVAFITRHQALVPALDAALGRETEDAYAAEIVRALTLIRGEASDAVLAQAAGRLGPASTAAWIEMVMRLRPGALLTHLTVLPDKAGESRDRALSHLAATAPEDVAAAFATMSGSVPLQQAFKSWIAAAIAASGGVNLPPWPMLSAALRSTAPVRRAVLFAVAIAHANGRTLPAEAIAALSPDTTGRSPDTPPDPWETVLGELVRRAAPGVPRRSLEPIIASLPADAAPGSFWVSALLWRLEKAEAAAMERIAGAAWRPKDHWMPTSGPAVPTPPPSGPVVTRLPKPVVPALVPDLARLLGCTPAPQEVAVLSLAYRTSGQARELATQGGARSPSCTQAARIVAALEIAADMGAVPEARRDVIVVPIRPADLKCLSRPMPSAMPARVGERIRAPRKTKQVEPYYPPELIARGVQGTVLLEAVITATGCVAEARVVRAIDPMLDLSAILAVSQWEYTPTYLDGRPVPVVMTVTMNYSLR